MHSSLGTGADVVLTEYFPSKNPIESLTVFIRDLKTESSHQEIRKIGIFATGSDASLCLEWVASGISRLSFEHLEALCVFYPESCRWDVSQVPILCPVQAHFAIHEKDQRERASKWDALWKASILAKGGFHAHGLHSNEERIYTYPALPGFLNHKGKETNDAWTRVFPFFKTHLKQL